MILLGLSNVLKKIAIILSELYWSQTDNNKLLNTMTNEFT